MTPRIIIENRIPYIKGLLEPVAQVTYLPANEITRQAVSNAQALVVRTRTWTIAARLESRWQAHQAATRLLWRNGHLPLWPCGSRKTT